MQLVSYVEADVEKQELVLVTDCCVGFASCLMMLFVSIELIMFFLSQLRINFFCEL